MLKEVGVFRSAVLGAGLMLPFAMPFGCVSALIAQAPAAAAGRQSGTVTAVAGNSLTLKTDAGQQVVIGVADGTRILQVAPGSTDLKSAQTKIGRAHV